MKIRLYRNAAMTAVALVAVVFMNSILNASSGEKMVNVTVFTPLKTVQVPASMLGKYGIDESKPYAVNAVPGVLYNGLASLNVADLERALVQANAAAVPASAAAPAMAAAKPALKPEQYIKGYDDSIAGDMKIKARGGNSFLISKADLQRAWVDPKMLKREDSVQSANSVGGPNARKEYDDLVKALIASASYGILSSSSMHGLDDGEKQLAGLLKWLGPHKLVTTVGEYVDSKKMYAEYRQENGINDTEEEAYQKFISSQGK